MKAKMPQRKIDTTSKSVEEIVLRKKLEENAYPWTVASSGDQNRVSFPAIKQLTTSNALESRLMSRTLSSSNYNTAKYSEEDVSKMMSEVMTYCRSLQSRVQDLEVQLIQVSKNKSLLRHSFEEDIGISDNIQPRGSTVRFAEFPQPSHDSFESVDYQAPPSQNALNRSASFVSNRLRPVSETQREHHIHHQHSSHHQNRPLSSITSELVVDIDHKVTYLKEIFKRTDPIEQRKLSAIKIQSVIRGFSARMRLRSYKTAIRDWRWMRCRPVIWLLDILLANQSKFDSGFHLLTMNRTMRTLVTVFNKWAIVCRQNAPLRYQIKQAAQEKIHQKRFKFMAAYFEAFKAVTIGRISLRNANKERREMIDRIRKELSNYLREKGLIGIVPQHEIQKMLHRRVIDEFKLRKRIIVMKGIMNRFRKLVELTALFQRKSEAFRFRKLAGGCFYAWSDYTYLSSLGLDRKRWPGPRKYEVRYNQKRVDNFARLRCEKLIFTAWKGYFHVQITVKRKYQRKIGEFISSVFHAWKSVSSHSRRLRRLTYENWTGYSKIMVQRPFHAWADHVRAMKNRYQEHLRIARSYIRWKERQRLLLIIKVWRHQALFGRIDGLYTRQMLLKTVADQKIFVTSLEKTMADQTMELEECKQMVLSEIDRKAELEIEIQKLNQDNNKLKMANHNYEQELKRLESVIQAMLVINPKQMEHLKRMQPEFKFKERNIALSESTSILAAASGVDPAAEATNASSADAVNEAEKDRNNGNQNSSTGKGTGSTTIPAMGSVTRVGVENTSLGENDSVDSTNKIGPLLSDEGSTEINNTKVNGTYGNESIFALPASSIRDLPTESNSIEGRGQSIANDSLAGNFNEESSEKDVKGKEPVLLQQQPGKENAALSIEVKFEKSNSAQGPAAEHASSMPTPHTNSDHDQMHFHSGPNISIQEQRMLERANWIIKRYKNAWPSDDDEVPVALPDVDVSGNKVTEKDGDAENPGVEIKEMTLDKINSASYDSTMSFASQYNRSKSFVSGKSSPLRNSLLRGSNPFLRIDIGVSSTNTNSFVVPPSPASITSRQPSISLGNNGVGSFRSSFSRNISSAIAAAVQAVENPPDLTNNYYSDTELEEIVIIWAKMLFTILEFLETGDITNLPKEDKRLWAEHLLEESRHVSDIPYEVLYDRDEDEHVRETTSLKSGASGSQLPLREDDNQSFASGDTEKITRALMNTTMITVDQLQVNRSTLPSSSPTLTMATGKKLQPESITWREGLLRLRTMFPGAGNFSGFGVGIEAPEDTALFQRLLKMREDLKKIENVQTLRYQRQFYESQKLLEQQLLQQRNSLMVTTPSGKKVKAFKPSSSPNRSSSPPKKTASQDEIKDFSSIQPDQTNAASGREGEDSVTGVSITSSVDTDNQSLHLSRPLGTNIYAGNLKKLLSESNNNNSHTDQRANSSNLKERK